MRSVLVTGGAGYIGAHVAKALAAAGFMPVVLDNLVHGHADAVRWGPLVRGDVGDSALVGRALVEHRIAAVVHLAGFAFVGESVAEPLKYFRNNVASGILLLEAMRTAGVGCFVFSSTCAVYGQPEMPLLTEAHPTRPLSPYGQSKLMFEQVLQAAGQAHGLRWMALRYFNAAGADPDGSLGEDHDPEPHLIPRACLAALRRLPALDILGTDYPTEDGTAIRDYVHVSDLAQAHVDALQHLLNGGDSRPLNLGTGRGQSVRAVVAAVERAANRPVPVRAAARRPGDAPALIADASEAARALGWRPRYTDLDSIVASAWRWHARGSTDTGGAPVVRTSPIRPRSGG